MGPHAAVNGGHDCRQEDRLGGIDRELGRLNETVFFGPTSLITEIGSIRTVIRILCWLVGGSCMAVIGQLAVLIFQRIVGH